MWWTNGSRLRRREMSSLRSIWQSHLRSLIERDLEDCWILSRYHFKISLPSRRCFRSIYLSTGPIAILFTSFNCHSDFKHSYLRARKVVWPIDPDREETEDSLVKSALLGRLPGILIMECQETPRETATAPRRARTPGYQTRTRVG